MRLKRKNVSCLIKQESEFSIVNVGIYEVLLFCRYTQTLASLRHSIV